MKQTMKSCILEQPDTIRRVCQNAEKVCDSVYSIVGKGPFDKIYLIGSGTSLHTAIAAKYAFTKWFNAEVQVFTPFDFLYYYPHYRLDEKTLILGISQTARSIGTIHCLEKGREYAVFLYRKDCSRLALQLAAQMSPQFQSVGDEIDRKSTRLNSSH